jgi:tRNA (cmo5U34)-methyltransferase
MTDIHEVFDSHAADYNSLRRRLVPPFDAFYGSAVAAVGLSGQEPARMLDLGAGTGMLSAFLRRAYPAAHLTLLDSASRMLDQAREAVGESKVTYVRADLGDPLPPGSWDAVVSALAIHHLDDDGKRALMRRVYAALNPGGVFVNAEQVAGPSAFFDAAYARSHETRARAAGTDDAEWAAAVERMSYDRRASVEAQLAWLLETGFDEVDCVFKDYGFAVMVALRE